MPLFATSEEWQAQSSLLIQAHPSTTYIKSKYNIPNLASERHIKKQRKRQERARAQARAQAQAPRSATESDPSTTASKNEDVTSSTAPVSAEAAAEAAATKTPKATFELKTYDPVSGVVLKYKTDKAAEVSRLIATTGRLARDMVGLLPAAVLAQDDIGETVDDTSTPKKSSGSKKDAHIETPVGTKSEGNKKKKKKKKGKR